MAVTIDHITEGGRIRVIQGCTDLQGRAGKVGQRGTVVSIPEGRGRVR